MPDFTWIPFYRELTKKVLTFEENQPELLGIIQQMKDEGLPGTFVVENLPDGTMAPLSVMDPFTFMMNLHIVKAEKTLAMCRWLKRHWNLSTEVPTDVKGLPEFLPISPWFFASEGDGRKADDISKLWRLAYSAHNSDPSTVDPALYKECRKIKGTGLAKLTTGLFWFSPHGFLPIAGPVPRFLRANQISWDQKALDQGSLQEFATLIDKSRQVNENPAEISNLAWEWQQNLEVAPRPAKPTGTMGLASASVRELLPREASQSFPLNSIFYGPPGTGKTFTTIDRALDIIDGYIPPDRNECVERFEALRQDGRIAFVTFHQSYSYEEFIEGLRPVVESTESNPGSIQGAVRYTIRDGIFKRLALTAIGAGLTASLAEEATFESLWTRFKKHVADNPGWLLKGLQQSEYAISFTARGTVVGKNVLGRAKEPYNASVENIRKVWENLPREERASNTNINRILGKASHDNLIGAIVEELKRMQGETPTFSRRSAAKAFLDSNEEYTEISEVPPRYVLIIDEINRGNISKILGELITLLEDDKRLGASNELRVTLPYSNETFAVPGNLYLIGTMNTADKSLALLDIALRRRFSFEEMKPDFSVCENLTPEMRSVLEELNRRILRVLDREHRIGHAFFVGIPAGAEGPGKFNEVFGRRIVPLLQEYFYNDWNSLRAVLGESGKGRIVLELPKIETIKSRTQFAWWDDLDLARPDFLEVLTSNYSRGLQAGATGINANGIAISGDDN